VRTFFGVFFIGYFGDCYRCLLTVIFLMLVTFIFAHEIFCEENAQTAALALQKPADSLLKGKKDSTLLLPTITVASRRFTNYSPSQTVLEAKTFSGKYQDLQSVLATVSGVTVRNVGGFGHYAEAAVRGCSPNQVQLYIDGIPQNGANGNAVDISKIPLSTLQTITVSKNIPDIEFFGDNAGGVINLSTATTDDMVAASIEGGSFGYFAANSLIGKKCGKMSHRFSLNYAGADNNYPYLNDRGTILGPSAKNDDTVESMDNNFFSSFSAMYTNIFNFNSVNKLTSQLSANRTKEGIFYFPQAGANDGFIKNNRFSIIETYSAVIDTGLMLTIRANAKNDEELFQRFKPFYVYSSALRHEINQPQVGLHGILKSVFSHRFYLTCDASFQYDGFDYKDLLAPPNQLAPRFSRFTEKAGVEAGAQINEMLKARLGGIYKYEHDSTNGHFTLFEFTPGGQSAHEGFPGGFGEITVEPLSGLHLLLGIRYGSRSPGFSEKYSLGANYAGNSVLKPETRIEYESGFSFNNSFAALTASVFKNTTKDKIVFTMNSQHLFYPQNMNEVDGWGLESEVSIFPTDWLAITNSATYMENIVHSTVTDWNGHEEPMLPRFIDYQKITVHFKKFYAGHSAQVTSPYFKGPDNVEKITHDYPELGVNAGFLPAKSFDIGYRLENYLNVRDYDFPQRPIPGIRHYFVFKYHFN
jgi:outer membrane cobalamin receptor